MDIKSIMDIQKGIGIENDQIGLKSSFDPACPVFGKVFTQIIRGGAENFRYLYARPCIFP